MRASAVWLLLASCHRAEDAGRLQDLLSRTPIPVARVREALEIKPGELEILGGDAPDLFDASSPPRWAVMNRGTRPVWLHREDLTVFASVEPLLTPRPPPQIRRVPDPPRPEFNASEWTLLLPQQQAPLHVPAPSDWGHVQWFVRMGEAGRALYAQADGFNAKGRKEMPEDWPVALANDLGGSTHLPPFSWDGNVAGRAPVALDLRTVGKGELAWEAEYPGTGDRPAALALWAYS